MLDSTEDVTRWLTDIGLAHCAERFITAGLVGKRRYEEAFHTVLNRAGSRFLYVAHLTGLLRDRTLALDSIADLPRSAGLYEHFLRQLERTLASSESDGLTKTWEFVQRVILLFAAAEQAHEWDYRLEPAGYTDPEFRGLPLDVLADLLGESGRTYRLVFALYSVKDILAAWKGEQARDASYRLGLKDFVATVAALWPEKLAATHRQLARAGYEKWQAQSAELLGNNAVALHTLAMLLAHAALSGERELAAEVQHAPQVRDGCLSQGDKYYTQAQYRLAVRWWSRALWVARTITENIPTVENRDALAGALMNKGVALADLGQLPAAIACHRILVPEAAVELRAKWQEKTSLSNKLEFFFRRTLSAQRCLIVLDNLEDVLDDENRIRDEFGDLRQFVETCLEWDHGARVIATSRRTPVLSPEVEGRTGARRAELRLDEGLPETEAAALLRELDTDGRLNQTTGHWYSVAHGERTLAVRSERSRASGEVEEQAGCESGGLRLRCATLRPNGDGINC